MLRTIEGGNRPQVYVQEAEKILRTLRQARPVRSDSVNWEAHRAAGLVIKGVYGEATVTVTTNLGERVETPVRGTVPVNEGRETLVVIEDSELMMRVLPKP